MILRKIPQGLQTVGTPGTPDTKAGAIGSQLSIGASVKRLPTVSTEAASTQTCFSLRLPAARLHPYQEQEEPL